MTFHRYDLLDMLLQEGGDPNVEGRDGSLPLMVCLVPLVNRDHLHHFTHTMKVCYLNCVRILLKFGANPNCSSRSNLTPLHVLNFTATENISLTRDEDKAQGFEFVRNLLTLLLHHGLDPNVRFSERSNHVLLSLMDIVQNARVPKVSPVSRTFRNCQSSICPDFLLFGSFFPGFDLCLRPDPDTHNLRFEPQRYHLRPFSARRRPANLSSLQKRRPQ